MRFSKKSTLFTALLLSCTLPVQAEDNTVAYIKTVTGSVEIISGEQKQAAKVGSAVHDHDILKTAEESSAGLSFKDNTVLSIGPNTHLVVDDFLYAPEQSQLKLAVNLVTGTLQYVSGMIAKLKPEAVQVKTPSGMIGVRGTRFVVKVGDE